MSHTLTIRLSRRLADWLDGVSETTGVSKGQVVRDQLEKALATGARKPYMRLAGTVRGTRDLSMRKGFSR
jgi:hypothetical protein